MFDLEKGLKLIDDLKRNNETLSEVEYKRNGEFNESFKELLKYIEEQKKLPIAS